MADPDQAVGEQAPHQHDQQEGADDRRPFRHGQGQRQQFIVGQGDFLTPALEWAVVPGKLLVDVGQGAADHAQHALLGGRLGLPGTVPQLFQVAQQLGTLLVVFQGLDHLIQRLAQRLGGLFGRFLRTAPQQAGQADCLGGNGQQKQNGKRQAQEKDHQWNHL